MFGPVVPVPAYAAYDVERSDAYLLCCCVFTLTKMDVYVRVLWIELIARARYQLDYGFVRSK